MIKIISNVKDGNALADVEMAGDLTSIVCEIGSAISGVYSQIKAQDKRAASTFRFLLTELISNECSPMWGVANDHTVCRAAIVRDGEKLNGDDIADLLRRGMPKDLVKALLEDM